MTPRMASGMNNNRAAPVICMVSSMHPARDTRVFQKEARSLAASGFNVIHLCRSGSDEAEDVEDIDGVQIRRFQASSSLLGRLLRIPRLMRFCTHAGADVLHCNEVDSWIAGILASWRTGARVVFDAHEHYPSAFGVVHLPNWLHRPAATAIRLIFRVLCLWTDGVVFAKASVAPDFPIPESRTALVRNFPPLRLLDLAPSSSAHTRTTEVVAIHTGFTGRIRGWPELLAALAKPEAKGVQAHFVGAFNDDSSDDFWRDIKRLNLQERVKWEPWVEFDDSFERMIAADIGLVLFQPGIQNHIYASPNKLFEYMLAGLPVIAPRFAIEVADVVETYECGLLVDPADPMEIASALQRLAGDRELRAAMGTRGRVAVIERLNWEREAETLRALYARLGVVPIS